VLFAGEPEARELFAEETPSTLWPSLVCLSQFVDEHRAAYELGGFEPPASLDVPRTQWTDAMHEVAQAAFSDWEARNEARLKRREQRRLDFFEPDAQPR
jgi:hypothetical protein